MTRAWGAWVDGDPAAGTPYVDWTATLLGPGAGPALADQRGAFVQAFRACGLQLAPPDLSRPFPRLMLPAAALAPGGVNPPDPARPLPVAEPPPAGSVIVGVIDMGFAPAHARFRTADRAGTRILSLWRQGGDWEGQRHLPFGTELGGDRIAGLMARATRAGAVDEEAFDRAAGLLKPARQGKVAWTLRAASHGTAAADLAAGADPSGPATARLRDRARLILVDMPPGDSIGTAGTYLEYFAIWGLWHIAATADALWAAGPGARGAGGGYPIVVNLSWGLAAGPGDAPMLLGRALAAFNAARADRGLHPVRLVLPAGNTNLARGAARLPLAEGAPQSVIWRHLPADASTNCVEVWGPPAAGPGAALPFAVALAPPGGPAGPAGPGRPGQTATLTDATGRPVARVYCVQPDPGPFATGPAGAVRAGYVLCTAPGAPRAGPAAPAGAWRIEVAPAQPGLAGASVDLQVQTDQDLGPRRAGALGSYFDTPGQPRHDPAGRPRDTVARDPATGAWALDDPGPVVFRRGTVNALLAGSGALGIAGFRLPDGAPAPYSGSGRGGAEGPVCALPSEDGAALPGRLAAGNRSAGAVALSGTSFAAAEATRVVALRLLDWLDAGAAGPMPGDPADLAARAAATDPWGAPEPGQALTLKLGAGRLPAAPSGRPARR